MIDPRNLDDRLKALEAGTVPAGLMRRLTQTILAVTTDAAKGRYAGSGNPQNDTFAADDNVDATHPLNIRYIIPGNCQRVVSARLSFHLAPYRTYTSAANNPAVTTGGGSAHSHTVTIGDHTHSTPAHSHLVFSFVSGIANGYAASSFKGKTGAGADFLFDFNAGVQSDINTSVASGSATSGNGGATTPTSSADSTHTHSVTSNVTLVNGVVEAGTASGVTIAFDGVDKTSLLAGPWSSDVVEIDVLKYIQQSPDKRYHTIALTPAGLGRIEAHLRLGYFADVSIPA